MTIETLIHSAQSLKQPSTNAQQQYEQNIEKLAEMVSRTLSERDDIIQLVGEHGVDMMTDNHRNHARFMAHLFKEYSGKVFVDTILWVLKTYKAHGFHSIYWSAQINAWLNVIQDVLEESAFQEIKPFYEWLIINMADLQNCEQKVAEETA